MRSSACCVVAPSICKRTSRSAWFLLFDLLIGLWSKLALYFAGYFVIQMWIFWYSLWGFYANFFGDADATSFCSSHPCFCCDGCRRFVCRASGHGPGQGFENCAHLQQDRSFRGLRQANASGFDDGFGLRNRWHHASRRPQVGGDRERWPRQARFRQEFVGRRLWRWQSRHCCGSYGFTGCLGHVASGRRVQKDFAGRARRGRFHHGR